MLSGFKALKILFIEDIGFGREGKSSDSSDSNCSEEK